MAVSLAKNVFFALLLTFIATVHAVPCAKPRVRREWRSISEAEREEWVAAVKVRDSVADTLWLLSQAQCLKTVPHTTALAPNFDASVTRIPPVNPNSSYFDGTRLSPSSHNFSLIFPTRLCLRSYGSEPAGGYSR